MRDRRNSLFFETFPKVTVCPPRNTFTDLNYDLQMVENKTMENKSTSETSNLENKQHESTKLDNPLSFGMARLLGDVQKKIVSGKDVTYIILSCIL